MFGNILGGIGLVLLFIGGCAMDSPNKIVPAAMAICGTALCIWAAYEDGQVRR